MPKTHEPKNYLEKITDIWAFVSVDEGGEGIVGMTMELEEGRKTFMPFVCADEARVASLRPHAIGISKATGKKIKLVKFSQREEIEDIPHDF